MAWLTQFALERTRFTVFLMIGLLISGSLLYVGFPKREDPAMTIRVAVVTVEFPGMPPERIEKLIAIPVERKIREIPEVDEISTRLTTGRMTINVALKDQYTNLEPIWQELRDKMDEASRGLPDGARGPFVNTNFGDVAIATVALTAEGFSYREMEQTAERLQRTLYLVSGIAKVDLYGVQEERVWLEIDAERLASIGIQLQTVIDDLQKQNIILPAGTLNANGTTILLEATGDFESVEEIADLLTKVQGLDDFVRLRDLMTVHRGFVSPMQRPVFFDGRPSIVLSVEMQEGFDIAHIGRDLEAEVAAFEASLPIGYTLQFATFQPADVTQAVDDAVSNVLQTFLVVLIVVMLFLGLRSGLIIASIVPFAIMFALLGMSVFGIDMEQVSIAAVIISLGLLVDNGVVVVEDILRQLGNGVDRTKAALNTGKQFAIPLGVASLTTICAFLPFLLLEGSEGEYVFSLGAVVALTLVGSWLASLYFLPLISSRFLKSEITSSATPSDEELGPWAKRYGQGLKGAMRMAVPVVAVCYVGVIVAVNMLGVVPKQMFPESERAQVLLYMSMPKGTHISETRQRALEVSNWLGNVEENPGVTNQILYVGDGGPRFYLALSPAETDPSSAFFLVNTETFGEALGLSQRAPRYLIENHPEAQFKVKRLAMGASESGIVEIEITGPDLNGLLAKANEVEEAFRQAPGLAQNENDWGNKVVKTVIDIDQDKARRLGVTSESSAQLLSAYFDGFQISEYREDDQSIPIMVRASETDRDSLEDLLNIILRGDGGVLSLEQVATIRPVLEFSQIRRLDQVRTIKVSAKSTRLTAEQLLAFAKDKLGAIDLSGGYNIEIGGETSNSAEANAKIAAGFPIALLLMALAIVFQFNSFRRAGVIFMTIPLVVIGVPFGLLLFGEPMSFFGTLGLISLAGIIINNAIVLIDQIDIERETLDLDAALVAAGQKRLRPILLTSATTILGLTPLYLFGGALWSPLAVVMISGLAIASVLTLFFVPAVYKLMFRKSEEVTASALAS